MSRIMRTKCKFVNVKILAHYKDFHSHNPNKIYSICNRECRLLHPLFKRLR